MAKKTHREGAGPTAKNDAPSTIKVMIAACGMLRDNELVRQHKAGIVKNFGEMLVEGTLLLPDRVAGVQRTPAVIKAIEDGWIVCMGEW